MNDDRSRHLGASFPAATADDMFLRVAQAVSIPIDEHFFDQLTRRIVDALSVKGGVIALLDSADRDRVRSQSFILNDRVLDSICYAVIGTPCAAIVRGESRAFAQGIQQRFPDDPMLAEHGLEAYAGTPVHNRAGKVIGIVAVFHDRPLLQPERVLSALLIFAARVAAEIERRRSEQQLALTGFALDQTREAIYLIDDRARLVDVNEAACRTLGYERAELLGLTIPDIDPEYSLDRWQEDWAILRQQGSLTFETVHRRKDGSCLPVEISANHVEHDGRSCDLALARDITERKRTELIRATETRALGMIADGAALPAILEAIAQGIEALLDHALASILLLDPDGKHLRHGAAPSLPEAYNRAVDGIAIGPTVGSCGTAIHRRETVIVTDIDTDPLWAEYRTLARQYGLRACWSVPVMDPEGHCVASLALYHREPRTPSSTDFALVATSTDLIGIALQRHRQAQALRSSEERFRQLAESIDDVFWMTDALGRGLYVSPAYERIWGLPCEGLHQDSGQWFEAIHEADRPRMAEALRRQNTVSSHLEYRVIRPDGTIRWIADRAFPILDESGAVYRIAGVARDITKRKQAELALQERLKELRCLYRVLELTTDDTRSVDAICADIASILPTSLLHEDVAVTRIVLGDAELRSTDWQTPVASLRSPITDAGHPIGFVEIGYRAARPDQAGGEGPILAEERTLLEGVTTHIQRMIDGRRMAETLARSQRLESVGQLTGGIAHDFNNLLTVIQGNAELLAEELAANARLHPLADMVVQGAQRGAELTHRLLAFARKQALEPKAVDVNQLIGNMDGLLRRTLGEHIEIALVRDTAIWPALVDPGQLESALLNLCINARDAMTQGGRLTIETGNAELDGEYAMQQLDEVHSGEYVLVAVSDTGTGIPPEYLTRVFEPFFTTKEVGKGTGLGLSMVYGFVKQSRGHVKLYSEPGEGTTVKLYLPRLKDTKAPPREPTASSDTTTGGTETILLVEDQALVRTYAETQLRHLGYRVLSAATGSEALAILRAHDDIDLLFTDIVMPGGMSGRELADAARKIRPGLKALYTSGYTDSAIVHHGRLDPGVLLLSKPYRRAELAHRIRQALDGV